MDTPITNSIFRGAALSAVPLNKLGSLKEFLISWIGKGFNLASLQDALNGNKLLLFFLQLSVARE